VTRVLHLMAGAELGGAEGFFTRLVPALARSGLDQAAAIRPHRARQDALTKAGVRVTAFRFGGWWDLATRAGIAALARRERPDVVLAWMSRAAAVLPTGPWTTMARLGGYYDLKYYRRAAHLIGNTPDIRRYLLDQGIAADRAHYLPNFVDATPAQPVARALLGVPDGVRLILCLGRLHPNKGFDTAIRALSVLDDAHLVIAGEGPERSRLEALAQELGLSARVHLAGWRDDVPALLAACDVFLCASRHEPLGNMVLEAWAHGRPVVAAAAQGPMQLIRDGVSGLLTPIDDAGAMADALRRVTGDGALADRLIAGGRAAHAAEFSESQVVAAYRDLFEKVRGACAA